MLSVAWVVATRGAAVSQRCLVTTKSAVSPIRMTDTSRYPVRQEAPEPSNNPNRIGPTSAPTPKQPCRRFIWVSEKCRVATKLMPASIAPVPIPASKETPRKTG